MPYENDLKYKHFMCENVVSFAKKWKHLYCTILMTKMLRAFKYDGSENQK